MEKYSLGLYFSWGKGWRVGKYELCLTMIISQARNENVFSYQLNSSYEQWNESC